LHHQPGSGQLSQAIFQKSSQPVNAEWMQGSIQNPAPNYAKRTMRCSTEEAFEALEHGNNSNLVRHGANDPAGDLTSVQIATGATKSSAAFALFLSSPQRPSFRIPEAFTVRPFDARTGSAPTRQYPQDSGSEIA
jgi:hypothetical protein